MQGIARHGALRFLHQADVVYAVLDLRIRLGDDNLVVHLKFGVALLEALDHPLDVLVLADICRFREGQHQSAVS